MRKLFILLLLMWALPAVTQTVVAVNGDCSLGGQVVNLGNLPSTSTTDPNTITTSAGAGVQASYPQCSVTVYLTGTLTKATIYSNSSHGALSNPFTATVYGSYLFYVVQGQYDIVINTGAGPAMPIARTLTAVPVGGLSGSGTVTSLSTGGLSPLFSASISNPTTTPALSFSLTAAAQRSVYANCTGSTATPLFCLINTSMLPFTYSGNTSKIATVSGSLSGGSGAAVCQDGSGNVSGTCPGSGVISFNSRSGVVTPQTGDYSVSQVTGAAPLASPSLTGTPTSPTPTFGDNTTRIASTQFVQAALAALSTGVVSVNGFTGIVVLTVTNISGAAPLASPALTGVPTVPTAAQNTNTTQIASTAFVLGQASNLSPLQNGTVAPGTSNLYSRADHVHPTDSTRAPLASPAFTGTPSAPFWSYLGATSGSTQWGAAPVAGTPNPTYFPTTNPNAGDALTAGTAGNPVQTTWAPRAKVYTCGTTTACSGTLQSNPQVVWGTVTLTAGAATVTGLPTFTSTSTFACVASDNTSTVTSAHAVPASATSITVTGTSTDVVSYICSGN